MHYRKNPNKNVRDMTFLEPSVGGGSLLRSLTELTRFEGSAYVAMDIDHRAVERLSKVYVHHKNVHIIKHNGLHSQNPHLPRLYDVIVGNPPWQKINWQRTGNENLKNEWKEDFKGANPNLAMLFLLHCLSLLESNGVLGFLIPVSIWTNSSLDSLRRRLLMTYTLTHVCSYGRRTWWEEVNQEFCYVIFVNDRPTAESTVCVCEGEELQNTVRQFDISDSVLSVLQGHPRLCEMLAKHPMVANWFKILSGTPDSSIPSACILLHRLRPQRPVDRLKVYLCLPEESSVYNLEHHWILCPILEDSSISEAAFLKWVILCLRSKVVANYVYERCVRAPTLMWGTSETISHLPLPVCIEDLAKMKMEPPQFAIHTMIKSDHDADNEIDIWICTELYGLHGALCTYFYEGYNRRVEYYPEEVVVDIDIDQ